MSLPPVPPRPVDEAAPSVPAPPPLPPLPPNFKPDQDNGYPYPSSGPHFENPLVAPRPHRVNPDLPADMARTLDEQASSQPTTTPGFPAPPAFASNPSYSPYGSNPTPGAMNASQPPGSINFNPGFVLPQAGSPNPPSSFRGGASPAPSLPPPGGSWNVFGAQTGPSSYGGSPAPPGYGSPPPPNEYPNDSFAASMAALSFTGSVGGPQGRPPLHDRKSSMYSTYGPQGKPPSPPRPANGGPALTAALPSLQQLTSALGAVQNSSHDPALRIAWCRDVLLLVERAQPNPATGGAAGAGAMGTEPVMGPVRLTDPQLARLAQAAVPIALQIAGTQPIPQPMPKHVAEALFMRACFANTGMFPDQVQQNQRAAFKDFEQAARNGHHSAWFKLGREYESVGDANHAKDCFERGVKHNVESCIYRMGMANLLGQLNLPSRPDVAVPLLQRAATLATMNVPQPAYVYGLLLLDEFSAFSIPPHLFDPFLPQGPQSREAEARKHLERAAFLNFAPAQYKLGHAYEFAEPPFPYDPLLSVQYYSLASQQGEAEADMALSKWFLCGADGAFEKDENLAYTFAEKAARKGLATAEFAMGYYAEVGVGGPKDVQAAQKWYTRAADHGNPDATERLSALAQAQPQSLTRQEHDNLTESTLVRKRTQAKERYEARPGAQRRNADTSVQQEGQQIVNVIRQTSLANRPAPQQQFQSPPPVVQSQFSGGPASQQQPLGAGAGRRPHHSASASAVDPRRTSGQEDPSGPGGPGPSGPSSIGVGPRPQPGRAFPAAHRHTLVDPGVQPSAGGPGRAQSPSGRPSPGPGGRPGREGSNMTPPVPQGGPGAARPAKPAGPQTFAEMGFQSQKLEEKECVIM